MLLGITYRDFTPVHKNIHNTHMHNRYSNTFTLILLAYYLHSELVAVCSEQQAYGSKGFYSVLSSSEDEQCEGDKNNKNNIITFIFITQ